MKSRFFHLKFINALATKTRFLTFLCCFPDVYHVYVKDDTLRSHVWNGGFTIFGDLYTSGCMEVDTSLSRRRSWPEIDIKFARPLTLTALVEVR